MKSGIFQVDKTTQPLMDQWMADARGDDTVWPYMGFSQSNSTMTADSGDDWLNIYLMDERRLGLLEVSLDRRNSNQTGSVSLWVLNKAGKRLAAGRLFLELPKIVKRYNFKYLNAACHHSNRDSMRSLHRRFGEPWGIQVENGWNGLLGRFEDTYHFRMNVQGWR